MQTSRGSLVSTQVSGYRVDKAIVNTIESIRRAKGTCHNFASSGVMYTVSTSSEAVADSNANETHLDIETLFHVH
jgi:hypothetical protein